MLSPFLHEDQKYDLIFEIIVESMQNKVHILVRNRLMNLLHHLKGMVFLYE